MKELSIPADALAPTEKEQQQNVDTVAGYPRVFPAPHEITPRQRQYVRRALVREGLRVDSLKEGDDRNNAINEGAYAVAGYIYTGAITAEDVQAEFLRAAEENGGLQDRPPGEVADTIRRAIEDGQNAPRPVPDFPAGTEARVTFDDADRVDLGNKNPIKGTGCSPKDSPSQTQKTDLGNKNPTHPPRAKEPADRFPIQDVPLTAAPPRIEWIVNRWMPRKHLSTIYAPAGVGKTRFISALAVQMARPVGLFLGRPVQHGRVVIIDADDPTGFGYLTWLNRFLNAAPDANRDMIQLQTLSGPLNLKTIREHGERLADNPPALIVLDTFASAFLGLDTIRAADVQLVLVELAELAARLNCAVVTLDHVGKLRPGETVATRGAYGSAKDFAPRAMFAMERADPALNDGRDIIRIDCTKQSYAPVPDPVAIEITVSDDEQRARLEMVAMPGGKLTAAVDAMRMKLINAGGQPVPRAELLEIAALEVDISPRYAKKALRQLLEDAAPRLKEVTLPGRGSPKAYIWQESSSPKERNNVRDDESFREQGVPQINREAGIKPVRDDESFREQPSSLKEEGSSLNQTGGPDADDGVEII